MWWYKLYRKDTLANQKPAKTTHKHWKRLAKMGRLDHLFMEFSFLIEWSGRGHQKIIFFSFTSGWEGETWLTDQTLSYCDTCWNTELFNTLNTTSSIKSGVISSFFFKMLLQQHYFVIFIIEKSPGCRKQSLLWGSTHWLEILLIFSVSLDKYKSRLCASQWMEHFDTLTVFI